MARSAEAGRLAGSIEGAIQPKPDDPSEIEPVSPGFLAEQGRWHSSKSFMESMSRDPHQRVLRDMSRDPHMRVLREARSLERTGGLWSAVRRSVAFRGRAPRGFSAGAENPLKTSSVPRYDPKAAPERTLHVTQEKDHVDWPRYHIRKILSIVLVKDRLQLPYLSSINCLLNRTDSIKIRKLTGDSKKKERKNL